MSTGCRLDVSGCLVCPEIPATPGSPARTTVDENLGWNAGANSVAELAGDVSVSDALDAVPNGLVVGLRSVRAAIYDPSLVDHAFMFTGVGSHCFATIVERGSQVGQPQAYALGTKFEIRRVGSKVYYLLGGQLLAMRNALTLAPVIVTACIYAAGDELP
jgi:hypothetical protein